MQGYGLSKEAQDDLKEIVTIQRFLAMRLIVLSFRPTGEILSVGR